MCNIGYRNIDKTKKTWPLIYRCISLISEMGLPKYSMAVGLNKGYKTTKIAEVSKHRQSRRKGVCQFNLYVISEKKFWT